MRPEPSPTQAEHTRLPFCLVHGAWHDGACWQPLVAELGHRGHECVVPVLPLHDDRASFDDYANVVVECLRDREPPVLVGHSMSSAVIPLVAVKRPVRLLVYLCPAMGGFARLPGEPPRRRADYEPPPLDASGRSRWPRERAIARLPSASRRARHACVMRRAESAVMRRRNVDR